MMYRKKAVQSYMRSTLPVPCNMLEHAKCQSIYYLSRRLSPQVKPPFSTLAFRRAPAPPNASASAVVFVSNIDFVAKFVKRVRQRHLSRDAVLIHITYMFVLQAVYPSTQYTLVGKTGQVQSRPKEVDVQTFH